MVPSIRKECFRLSVNGDMKMHTPFGADIAIRRLGPIDGIRQVTKAMHDFPPIGYYDLVEVDIVLKSTETLDRLFRRSKAQG